MVRDLADLKASINGPSAAADSSSFNETVNVTNGGPATAKGVITVLLVPGGVSVTSTGGGTQLGGVIYWTAGALTPGAQNTYTVGFRVAAHAHGIVSIPAGTVSTQVPDPNYANNAATTLVTLGPVSAHTDTVTRTRNPLAIGRRLITRLQQLTHHHRTR